MTTPTETWAAIVAQLQLQMTRATFESWVRDTELLEPLDQLNGRLVIGVQSDSAKDWLENRLRQTISRTAGQVIGHQVAVTFRVIGDPPVSAASVKVEKEKTPLPAPPPIDVSAGWLVTEELEKVIGFDLYQKNWVKHARYDAIFRRAYLTGLGPYGAAAWDVWDYMRAKYKDGELPWSPVEQIEPETLAEDCARRKSAQVIVGVSRRCQFFADGTCCGRRQGMVVKEEGVCKYRVPGALDILAAEGMAVFERRGKHTHVTYWIQIYRKLPLLSPVQAGRLPVKLRVEHEGWIKELGVFRAWSRREEENFLLVKRSLEGLELGR